jgi:hypothetical protein
MSPSTILPVGTNFVSPTRKSGYRLSCARSRGSDLRAFGDGSEVSSGVGGKTLAPPRYSQRALACDPDPVNELPASRNIAVGGRANRAHHGCFLCMSAAGPVRRVVSSRPSKLREGSSRQRRTSSLLLPPRRFHATSAQKGDVQLPGLLCADLSRRDTEVIRRLNASTQRVAPVRRAGLLPLVGSGTKS